MKIDIEHVAKLANLDLSDMEKKKFTTQIQSILGHFQTLNSIPTDHVKPLVHGADFETFLRDDEIKPSNSPNELYQNAPAHDEEGFEVNKII